MKVLFRVVILFIIIGLFGFIGISGYRYVKLKADANSIINKLKSGDYSILQKNSQTVDLDDIPEEFREDIKQSLQEQQNITENENGKEFWDSIMSKTTIKVKPSFFSNKVTFTIKGPDMRFFFQENTEVPEDVDVGQVISEYLNNAKETESSYTVHGTGSIGKWKLDTSELCDQKFIDCLSGGLLSSYADVYKQTIDELMEEDIQ